MFINLLNLVSVILLFIRSDAFPTSDITSNQMDNEETSTISKHITTNELVENKTALTLNISSAPVVITTPVNNIPNSTDVVSIVGGKIVNGKVVYYNTTYSYYDTTYSYYSGTTPSTTLSGGAIAGIVIGVIVLLCCCGLLGSCKSGHWETRDVWIRH